MFDVIVLVGSLRQASISRRLAQAIVKIAPPMLSLELVDLGSLPIYNEDLERALPDSWRDFRARVRRADAVLVVTPEYNRSIPGVLKNALDVGSRPYGQSVWDSKPSAVVSQSPGALGAFGANHHVRQCFVFLNMPTMQQPEVYLGGSATLLDEGGEFHDPEKRQFLERFLAAFERWVTQTVPTRAASAPPLTPKG